MDPTTDRDDREVITALRRTAEVPLGMTSRLEASVSRRDRLPVGLTIPEKCCLASGALIPFVAGGAVGGITLLLIGVAGVLGYLQWTVLVDDPAAA